MEYFIKNFEKDKKYVGIKYEGEIKSFKNVNLPELWNEFTEKLANSNVKNLIDNNEAIGYISYQENYNKAKSYDYIAACEVMEFEDCDEFSKIVIPSGKYLFFKIRFQNKAEEIDKLFEEILLSFSSKFNLNDKFSFEFYPEEFNHIDENTYLYFAVQLLEDN